MRLYYARGTPCPRWNSAALLASKSWILARKSWILASQSWPRRPREPHGQRKPQDNADRQRRHRRLRRPLKAHPVPVDHDEAERLGRHAPTHALGDQTIASPESKAGLRNGNDGSLAIDDRRTEHGRGVGLSADCFRELDDWRGNVLLQAFRLGVRQSPHGSLSSALTDGNAAPALLLPSNPLVCPSQADSRLLMS